LLVRRGCIVTLAYLVATATSSCAAKAVQPGGPMPQLSDSSAARTAGAPTQTTGRVINTMDAGRYTYVQVDYGNEKIWAAAPQFHVEIGDTVIVPAGTAMVDFYSKTLDRTFDLVHFVAFVTVAGEGGEALIPSGHGDAPQGTPTVAIDLSGIERAEGGATVGEIFDQKASLAGQEVTVRGKVVKFTPGVMGKNWIHLQDGTTGAGDAKDLTVTSEEMAEVGNTILVRGVVAIDRDFGSGYKYDVIIDDAAITVE
jgi:hypothetical protein